MLDWKMPVQEAISLPNLIAGGSFYAPRSTSSRRTCVRPGSPRGQAHQRLRRGGLGLHGVEVTAPGLARRRRSAARRGGEAALAAGVGGQAKLEHRPLRTGDRQGPGRRVRLRQLAGDGQAQARGQSGPSGAGEGLEQALADTLGHARPLSATRIRLAPPRAPTDTSTARRALARLLVLQRLAGGAAAVPPGCGRNWSGSGGDPLGAAPHRREAHRAARPAAGLPAAAGPPSPAPRQRPTGLGLRGADSCGLYRMTRHVRGPAFTARSSGGAQAWAGPGARPWDPSERQPPRRPAAPRSACS